MGKFFISSQNAFLSKASPAAAKIRIPTIYIYFIVNLSEQVHYVVAKFVWCTLVRFLLRFLTLMIATYIY